MIRNPFLRRNMRFGLAVGLVTGALLSLALYAKSGHPVSFLFIASAAVMGYLAPYLMWKVNEED